MRYLSHHHKVGKNNNIPIRFRSLFIAVKVVPQPNFFLVQRQPLLRGNKKVREAGIFMAEAMLLIVCRDFINPSYFLGSLSGVLSLLQINPPSYHLLLDKHHENARSPTHFKISM